MDQLRHAYDVLNANPESRQVVLQIWDSAIDTALPDGTPAAQDIPCNIFSLVKIRAEKLEWTQITRSHDLFLGVPYNFVQFMSMQEILAGWLNIKCGSFSQFSDSLHIYQENSLAVEESISQETPILETLDSLALPLETSTVVFAEMERRAELLTKSTTTVEEVAKILRWDEAPEAYRNMISILGAEALRRRGSIIEAKDAADSCGNSLYRHIWGQWAARTSQKTGRPS